MLCCRLSRAHSLLNTRHIFKRLQEFGSFEQALQTEFHMLFGEFIDKWATDPQLPRELQVSDMYMHTCT
jgi:hypothetical protein